MTDLEALRRLPGVLLTAGYVDAVGVHGMLPLDRRPPDDLDLLPTPTATLVSVFARHGAAPRDTLAAALGDAALCDGLVRLGVLLDRGGQLSTGDLVALPLDGRLAFVPSPAGMRDAYTSEDMRVLFARMCPTAGDVLVLGGGPGLLALHAAITARRVVNVESDPVALGCADLNFAMNGVDARVESRGGALVDAHGGERFDRVVADLPGSPVPLHGSPLYGGLDGPELARRVVAELPATLAGGGIAQLSAAWHGGEEGPDFGLDLAAFAGEHRLRVAVTIPSRQSLAPGSPLVERLAARAARAVRTTPGVLRQRFHDHLASRRSTHLYLSFVTIARDVSPGVTITRHYVREGGAWTR